MRAFGPWLLLVGASVCASGCKDRASKSAKPGEPAAQTASGEASKASTPAAPKTVVPVPLPGDMRPAPWLEEATMVVAYASEGAPLIVAAGNGWLRWFTVDGEKLGERVGPGAPQVLSATDVDGDGTMEVLFARGMGRNAADAEALLEVLHITAQGATAATVPLPATTRQQVVGVAASPGAPNELWVASFVSKFEVEVGRYKNNTEAWELRESRGRHRVVSDLVVLPDGTPVIARMYGDTADEPGGIFALATSGEAVRIPSTRGARAILGVPGPRSRLAMADGWHKNYGRKAQGLISLASRANGQWAPDASVEVADNYGFTGLRLGNVHRQAGVEIIASGNGPAVVTLPERPDLVYSLGTVAAADACALNLWGDERDEVVIAGPKPVIWSAR